MCAPFGFLWFRRFPPNVAVDVQVRVYAQVRA